jgi:hypothetical protein
VERQAGKIHRRDNRVGDGSEAFEKLEVQRANGLQLKAIREHHKYRISDVARLTGIDVRLLIRIELGEAPLRRWMNRKLCDLYAVHRLDLL